MKVKSKKQILQFSLNIILCSLSITELHERKREI